MTTTRTTPSPLRATGCLFPSGQHAFTGAKCRRCGAAAPVAAATETTAPMVTAAPAKAVTYFDGKPEIRTSYGNQRGLAARDLGGNVKCLHGATLADGCRICRASGTVLLGRPA